MRKSENSLLDSVTGDRLLHRGGEASIYLLNIGGKPFVLKWYNDGFSFDESAVPADNLRMPTGETEYGAASCRIR